MKVKDLINVLKDTKFLLQIKKDSEVMFLEFIDTDALLKPYGISKDLRNKTMVECEVVNIWSGDMFIMVEAKL